MPGLPGQDLRPVLLYDEIDKALGDDEETFQASMLMPLPLSTKSIGDRRQQQWEQPMTRERRETQGKKRQVLFLEPTLLIRKSAVVFALVEMHYFKPGVQKG